MKTDELTNEQSLEIITRMIGEAKRSIARGGSFYFLLWGATVAVANFGHYALDKAEYAMPYLIWLVSLPALVITIIHGKQQGRKNQVSGHFDRIYGHIWLIVGVAMVCTILFMSSINFNHNAVILLLAGAGTYISGCMLRFNPLRIGAIVLVAAACLAFTQSPTDQNLIAGIGIIFGYIVPGVLLKRQEGE